MSQHASLARRLGILALTAALTAPALAAGPLTVNGQPIAKSVQDAFLAGQKAQGASESPELLNAIREELIRREVLVQEARKKGIDKQAVVIGQMELARQEVLIRTFLADYTRANPISDERLKAEYEAIKAGIGGTEYKTRHILVDKESDALEIIAQLKQGRDFAELAKQSTDPGSKDKGGDLGWNAPRAYTPPFAEAMARLQKGETTQSPVKSEFGFHIIQVEDTRPLAAPEFEEIKPRLLQAARERQIGELMQTLRNKAKIAN